MIDIQTCTDTYTQTHIYAHTHRHIHTYINTHAYTDKVKQFQEGMLQIVYLYHLKTDDDFRKCIIKCQTTDFVNNLLCGYL